MLEAHPLFVNSDRFIIDRAIIDDIALSIGDNYGDDLFEGYFADYAGMAKKYKPERILEIGVRYGYIAICMLLGFKEGYKRHKTVPTPYYRGIDDESYHQNSCAKANENFRKVVPWADAECLKWNSFDVWPNLGTFDFIHIDGNHDYHGVWNDLAKAWPILNPGGIILLDDATTPGISAAIDNFLSQFENDQQKVQYHRQPNERNHVYIRKAI